jgi:hypothetical protein
MQYPIHGGTMRLLISRTGDLGEAWQPCNSVEQVINAERASSVDYQEWGKNIEKNILKSKEFIVSLKDKGYKIAGFGAAAKGCIYLNAANIDHNQIDYIVDDTSIKQNKFVPGTGIEVVPRQVLQSSPVDYIVILAHNFLDYIIRSLKQDGYTGKFIVLLPNIRVI